MNTASTHPPTPALQDIQQFIDQQRLSPFQLFVFALCLLIMLADGFDAAAMGYVVPALAREWGLASHAFGTVLSASLVGLALGALAAGPIADRIGRKPVLVVSVFAFGACSLVCAWADSPAVLTAWRFLTGLGLGAATPVAVTLLSESVPTRHRALLLNGMFCGFTLGAALGGFAAAAIIPAFGWRGVFLLGGVVPVLLALVAAFTLTESARFMVLNRRPPVHVMRVVRRLTGSVATDMAFLTPTAPPTPAGPGGLALVLSRGLRLPTVMLWIAYFMGILVLYLITSWMPTLVKESGVSMRSASLVAALFPLGGTLGALVCGWLMSRMNGHRLVAAAFFACGILVWVLGQVAGHGFWLPVLTFGAGTFTGAALVSMPALAAGLYPTQARASGVGWMLGVGRLGGILGAVLGGVMLKAGLPTTTILALLALPAFTAAAALSYRGARRSNEVSPARQTA
jgi:AAHS family 4-hydroxybenzoate transporter-like MFS transporter